MRANLILFIFFIICPVTFAAVPLKVEAARTTIAILDYTGPPGVPEESGKYQKKKGDTLAMVAFIMSVTGFLAPIGIILGYIARSKLRKSGGKNLRYAKAAIILGWIVLSYPLLGLLIMLLPNK